MPIRHRVHPVLVGSIYIRPSDEGKTWPPPAPPREQPVETTVKEEITMPSFSQDIRPLFRDKDVSSMLQAFDLSSYDSVKAHAEAIYARVANGTMPCDGAWPRDRITLLRSWIDQGCTP